MTSAVADPDWREQQQRPLVTSSGREQELVVDWRLGELLRAGYPLSLAEQLAGAAHVDLHKAIELAGRGCAPATAARILL